MLPHLLHYLGFAGRIVAAFVGLLAIYLVHFLYENEEGKIQNKLVDVWIRIDEKAKASGSRTKEIINESGAEMVSLLNKIFGASPFSLRLVLSSMNLSVLGLITVGYSVAVYQSLYKGLQVQPLSAVFLICIGVLSGIAVFHKFHHDWVWYLITGMTVTFLIYAVVWRNVTIPASSFSEQLMLTSVVLTVSLLSDVLSIVLIKWVSRQLAANSSVSKLVLMLLLLLLLAVIQPALIKIGLMQADVLIIKAFALDAFLNMSTACLALIPTFVIFGLLIHRLIWPLISRLSYPIVQSVEKRRNVLKTIAMVSFVIAFNVEKIGIKFLIDKLR